MTLRVYSLIQPLVDNLGKIAQPWNSFFQQFTQAPGEARNVTVTASPFIFKAGEPGQIALVGGAISTLTLTRGNISININSLTPLVTLEIQDNLIVTYTVLPTLTFFPRY